MILLFLLTLLHSDPVDPSVAYSQLQLHTKPGHVDMWTMSESGCTCQGHAAYTCPCCAPGGCPCSQLGSQRCVQCGMEAACTNGELCFFSHNNNFSTSIVHLYVCPFIMSIISLYQLYLSINFPHQLPFFSSSTDFLCISSFYINQLSSSIVFLLQSTRFIFGLTYCNLSTFQLAMSIFICPFLTTIQIHQLYLPLKFCYQSPFFDSLCQMTFFVDRGTLLINFLH